jgi:hypothetical protein
MLQADGSTERVVVGPDLRNGQPRPAVHPRRRAHSVRLIGSPALVLGASTGWPGVVRADVEFGNLDELAAKYLSVAVDLSAILWPSGNLVVFGVKRTLGWIFMSTRPRQRASWATRRLSPTDSLVMKVLQARGFFRIYVEVNSVDLHSIFEEARALHVISELRK